MLNSFFTDITQTVGQLIGFGALATIVLSYWQKKKSLMITLQIIANIFFAVHYYMLSLQPDNGAAFSGAISSVVQVGVFVLCACRDKFNWNPIITAIPIILAFSAVAVFTYESPMSLMPVAASLISQIAFLQSNKVIIKIAGVISPTIWLIYVIAIGSYSGILTEILLIVFTALSLLRKADGDKPKA